MEPQISQTPQIRGRGNMDIADSVGREPQITPISQKGRFYEEL